MTTLKKYFKSFFAVMCGLLCLVASSFAQNAKATSVQEKILGVSGGTNTKHFYFVTSAKPDINYTMWWWNHVGGSLVKDDNHPTGWFSDGADVYGPDENGYYGLDFNVSYKYDEFGLLFVGNVGGSTKQTCDYLIKTDVLKSFDEFYIIDGDPKVYTSRDDFTGLSSAYVATMDGSKILARINGLSSIDPARLSVTDKTGKKVQIAGTEYKDFILTINIAEKDKININDSRNGFIVTYGTKSMEANVLETVKTDYIDQNFYYDGDDLGITINGSNTTFKSWAPVANDVELLLYKEDSTGKYLEESAYKKVQMKKGDAGVWSATVEVQYGDYYRYKITNNGEANLVCDIWNFCASPDSVASQIVDIKTDKNSMPEGWEEAYLNPHAGNGYTDNIIYEMHVRDWASGVYKAETGNEWKKDGNKDNGCYEELSGSDLFKNYLKGIGMTHVQLLPVFDQAEKNDSGKYNWGYNPYHYNVPEGRYASEGYTDGRVAVKEFRNLILQMHKAGLSVNMDVVYNHTSGTGLNSIYDLTVPKFFYRINDDGTYSNGSGCGNELATNHRMVKKYVIASLKHWMQDYHVNGFRFDLMGVHERVTMEEIYNELVKIDPSVMVYGEPWTGGSCAVKDGVTSSGSVGNSGYAVFDDDFRDAIKGAEFGGFQIGQVQEKAYDKYILSGLTGKTINKNFRNGTGNPSLALHYVECHDNYTLFDKLIYSTLGEEYYGRDNMANEFSYQYDKVLADKKLFAKIKAQEKLCAAYIFLSQGVPFINGGQEFMRTKLGNPDSYSADKKGGMIWTEEDGAYSINRVNTIDLSFADKYSDVYNTYRALIALRKDNAESFGCNKDAIAQTLAPLVTEYVAGNYTVYFNASLKAYKIKCDGKVVTLNEKDGTYSVAAKSSTVKSVPANSFVIIKTK